MEREFAGIIAAPLVEWVRALGYTLSEPSYRFYPDGSLRWEGITDFSRMVFRELANKVPGAIANCSFRPPAALGGGVFRGTAWTLTYPGQYGCFLAEFDECGLGIGPQDGRLVSEEEQDLARLPILIKLYRKITNPIADELAGVIRNWFSSTGSKGVFDDAGAKSVSPTMRFSGRYASFELDASGSGQEVLNTLYLAVLDWGMSRRQPLRLIDVAGDRNEAVFASKLSVPLL